MPFVNKRNLIFYAWTLLVILITITHTYAHGGIDDGHDEPATSAPAASGKGNLAQGNIGLGFGLTVMAALASALGSLTPFLDLLFPYIPALAHVKITESKGFLAGSLALSSGILLSLTLGDLFPEAAGSFAKSKLFDRKYSYLVAASIFTFTALLIIISKILIKKSRKRNGDQDELPEKRNVNQNENELPENYSVKKSTESNAELAQSKQIKRFKSLSIQIAVALAIHNFPEGLASFTTTIGSERIGILFAIALSLHKIPEGLIMSLPIYVATGSRWKAFAIAATVGVISQMLGAVLGYVLFVTIWNEAVSGVIFSIVTAALLYAILHGMLPMAHHYDPKDKYVTHYTFVGLIFFAIVSSIFALAE